MTLKDLLSRERRGEGSSKAAGNASPQVVIMRSDTHSQEIIKPPSFPPEEEPSHHSTGGSSISKRLSRFRSSSNASASSKESKTEKRLSLLHSRNTSKASSVNVPTDLPTIDDGDGKLEDKEAQWEERATILAKENPNFNQSVITNSGAHSVSESSERVARVMGGEHTNLKPRPIRSISNAAGDDHIQEAIRLHEAGDLARSTAMFGRLADPNGDNNALSQVLYGLALRHGWGIEQNPSLGMTYLSQAASNSAFIEAQALSSGMKSGGAAKGELVLAIYELANSFRHGWGVEKDPVAARSYYETAANLGDTDAMNEAAWCYEQGFGGKKDKFTAAKWYRRAEEKGNKLVGNSWIWKDKYNPEVSK